MSAEQIFKKIEKYSTFGDYGKAELLKMPTEPNQRKEKFEEEKKYVLLIWLLGSSLQTTC